MLKTFDVIFNKYKSNPILMDHLKTAYDFELKLRKGLHYEDTIVLFAKIYSPEGLWQVDFISEFGELLIKQLDQDVYIFQSVKNGIIEVEKVVNMRKAKELQDLRIKLSEKSFLTNILALDTPGKNFAEVIVFAIQRYRKMFSDYIKHNKFLWLDTGFNSAFELYHYLNHIKTAR